jgi:hypothetical protein
MISKIEIPLCYPLQGIMKFILEKENVQLLVNLLLIRDIEIADKIFCLITINFKDHFCL